MEDRFHQRAFQGGSCIESRDDGARRGHERTKSRIGVARWIELGTAVLFPMDAKDRFGPTPENDRRIEFAGGNFDGRT